MASGKNRPLPSAWSESVISALLKVNKVEIYFLTHSRPIYRAFWVFSAWFTVNRAEIIIYEQAEGRGQFLPEAIVIPNLCIETPICIEIQV